MTNHWIDMQNADVVMVCGSNVVENHPMAARWLQKARENGAKILSVDPRYTRTSSFSDHYCKIRSGTDIAFVGGMIHHALENGRIQRDYVANYTNASFIVSENFDFSQGLFSGFDQSTGSYDDRSSWAFEKDENGIPRRDASLTHPRCVFRLLKKHFSRYDRQTVCNVTGSPLADFDRICDLFTSTSAPGKAGTWLYAMGATQSTHGVQNVRVYAILQLLLGNIGVAGGGVNALRGESNVQGSTDMGLLYHVLPGYLASPEQKDKTLGEYLKSRTPVSHDPRSANWQGNTPKYLVSLLKAWYGDFAGPENEFAYQLLPKRNSSCSYLHLFKALAEGSVKGLFLFGQNPAVSGPNAGKERIALSRLKWMVAVDLFETETAAFWKRPGQDPKEISTEVFLLPAAFALEKEGSITNSGRWAQWRYRAANPPGDAKPDLWILDSLQRAVKYEYEAGGVFPDPIVRLSWDYGSGLSDEPDVHKVAREINGCFTREREIQGKRFGRDQRSPSFALLGDDGSTSSGCWIYCGSYPGNEKADNLMARRGTLDAPNNIGLFPGWAWCWPVNRRILYNRASVDENGRPWNPAKAVIEWNPSLEKWEGDVPDGGWPPGERHPFIMKPDGYGGLWAESLLDGPLPEHYEPFESPARNLFSSRQIGPAVSLERGPGASPPGDPKLFPVVATTCRMTEHWQSGAMTRNTPWLAELVPDMFAELGEQFAREAGIKNGDRILVESARGKIEAYALVSPRLSPFVLSGKTVHQISLVWHFGYQGLATGDSANMLTPDIGDPNTFIPEYKAFLCRVSKI